MEFVQPARTSELARTEKRYLLGGMVRILQPVAIPPMSSHTEVHAEIVFRNAPCGCA